MRCAERGMRCAQRKMPCAERGTQNALCATRNTVRAMRCAVCPTPKALYITAQGRAAHPGFTTSKAHEPQRGSTKRSASEFHTVASIPHVPLVDLNPIPGAHPPELILERFASVVFVLPRNVLLQGINMNRAKRERAVSVLPMEIRQPGLLGLDPFRRIPFQVANQGSDVDGLSQGTEKMNVILHATYKEGRAVQISTRPGEVSMGSFSKVIVV